MTHKLILVFCALTITGCGSSGDVSDEGAPTIAPVVKPDPITNQGPIKPASLLSCPSGSHLTYENFGEAFLRNYCVMCHSAGLGDGKRGGAPLGANFDTAMDAALWRAAMVAKASTDSSPEPPVNNVSGSERRLFAQWLNCGAPAN